MLTLSGHHVHSWTKANAAPKPGKKNNIFYIKTKRAANQKGPYKKGHRPKRP